MPEAKRGIFYVYSEHPDFKPQTIEMELKLDFLWPHISKLIRIYFEDIFPHVLRNGST